MTTAKYTLQNNIAHISVNCTKTKQYNIQQNQKIIKLHLLKKYKKQCISTYYNLHTVISYAQYVINHKITHFKSHLQTFSTEP